MTDTTSSDLTRFQFDILAALAQCGGSDYGLGIKSHLQETGRYEHINHGRLYPNLDELVDRGLIQRGEIDRRTNSYTITDAGLAVIRNEYNRLGNAIASRETSERTGGVVRDE